MTDQESIEEMIAPVAVFLLLLLIYKVVKYVWTALQLRVIARKQGRFGVAWMAWFPGFRSYLLCDLGERSWWFFLWILLFVPAQIFIVYLMVESLVDMANMGVQIAHGDIIGFISEVFTEDYFEAYLLALAVGIRTSIPLMLYNRLALVGQRNEFWGWVVVFVPLANLIALWWIQRGYDAVGEEQMKEAIGE